ncbi:MAG: hypothetical protein AAF658_15470, partial [Myxococcota bacterium]
GDGTFEELKRELIYQRQTSPAEMLLQNQIQGMSPVHRRELYSRAGRFDEELPVLIDWDMWRRLASLAYPYHVPAITAEHYLREGTTTSGAGQLTNMAGAKRLRWIDARLRVLEKPVPGEANAHRGEWVQHEIELCHYWRMLYQGDDMQDRAEAAALYERARRLMPDQLAAPRRLALLRLKSGDLRKAFTGFAECIERGSDDVSDFLYASLAGLKLARPRETLELLSHLASRRVAMDERSQAMISEYAKRARTMLGRSSALHAAGAPRA